MNVDQISQVKAAQAPTRTRAQINAEYSHFAQKAGDNEFKVKYLQAELKLVYERMSQLNLETPIAEASPSIQEVTTAWNAPAASLVDTATTAASAPRRDRRRRTTTADVTETQLKRKYTKRK